jgi:dTDP-glucose 4,6-dehydratase
MKILVTGGAGFIGSNYVRQVVEGDFKGISKVTVLDKLTYAGTKSRLSEAILNQIEFIQGDIRDKVLMARLVERNDAILNFAAETHVDRSIVDPEIFTSTNIIGTSTILDSVRMFEGKRFVQISTDEVYGTLNEGSWTEESCLLPNSPYSASKASADLICRAYARTFGMDVLVTRCSNNYGPFQFPEKVIPFFVTNLIEGKKVPLYGTGMNVRDWLHVSDHCRAINLVLLEGRRGEIYNVGGGRELTNLELTKLILQYLGKDHTWIQHVEDRKGHDFRYSVNFEKIARETGYSPSKSFEVGLQETINWYLENPDWWKHLKKT